jgi:predicted ribosomally synthesized peptide with SipW-like signal peptide
MKKLFLGLITIAVVTGLMVGGALAYFNDTETSSSNTFEAGSLDLKVGGYDDPYVETLFAVTDAVPGSDGSREVSIANQGTIDGTATIQLNVTIDDDVDLTEPELALLPPDTMADGELDENLRITILVGTSPIVNNQPLSAINGATYTLDALPADGSMLVTINWSVPSSTGNIIQSDTCSFNAVFTLTQS